MLRARGPTLIDELRLESRLLQSIAGVQHGFGTRAQAIPSETQVQVTRTQWKQVHGTQVAELKDFDQNCGEVDGLWTRKAGIPSAVITADCVPILLTRRDGQAVAALHAGWRGTFAEISKSLFQEQIIPSGQRPWEWIAAIGPCARECCYEVSPELATDFEKKFGKSVIHKKRHLDLVRANLLQLQQLGLEEVDTQTAHCTICSRDEAGQFAFHSYRREAGVGRQYSWIQR